VRFAHGVARLRLATKNWGRLAAPIKKSSVYSSCLTGAIEISVFASEPDALSALFARAIFGKFFPFWAKILGNAIFQKTTLRVYTLFLI